MRTVYLCKLQVRTKQPPSIHTLEVNAWVLGVEAMQPYLGLLLKIAIVLHGLYVQSVYHLSSTQGNLF